MKNREEIPVLIAEIKDELSRLETLAKKLSSQKGKLDSEEITESAALRLHNFYSGCERIFQLIAAEVNGFTPETFDWHKRLLSQVALDVKGVRPAVISRDTRQRLEELLRFRHVVRNIYGFELDPERVEKLVDVAVKVFPAFEDEINAFTAFLEELYNKS
jgi:uncharacterized protein YutE (UPF0331/DUF86 family)